MSSKYRIGDIVWYLNPRGCPVSTEIYMITECKSGFTYNRERHDESELFPDKDSALQSVSKYKYRIGDSVWLVRGTDVVQMKITGYGTMMNQLSYRLGEDSEVFCVESELYKDVFGATQTLRNFYKQRIKDEEDSHQTRLKQFGERLQRLKDLEDAARSGKPLPKEEEEE